MDLTVLTGFIKNTKIRANSQECATGLLDIINPKYKKNQKVVVLDFQWGKLVSYREEKVQSIKKNVINLKRGGLFYKGYHVWSNQFNDNNYNGTVNYYENNQNNYYIIPLTTFKKLQKKNIKTYQDFIKKISIF